MQALAVALDENPEITDVLPKTAARKRALIATLVKQVHERMIQRQNLIRKAWNISGLLPIDGADLPPTWPEESYDQLIVDELKKAADGLSSLREEEESELQDLQEEDQSVLEELDSEDPGVNLMEEDLVAISIRQTFEENDDSSDGDFIQIDEPDFTEPRSKRRFLGSEKHEMNDVEEDQTVLLSKGSKAKEIIVRYLTSQKPTPVQLWAEMQRQKPRLQGCEMTQVSFLSQDEFRFVVIGTDRTTVFDGTDKFHWVHSSMLAASE